MGPSSAEVFQHQNTEILFLPFHHYSLCHRWLLANHNFFPQLIY